MGDGDAPIRRFNHPSNQRPHAARSYRGYSVLSEARTGASGRHSGNRMFTEHVNCRFHSIFSLLLIVTLILTCRKRQARRLLGSYFLLVLLEAEMFAQSLRINCPCA
jgi:hypothetical protein